MTSLGVKDLAMECIPGKDLYLIQNCKQWNEYLITVVGHSIMVGDDIVRRARSSPWCHPVKQYRVTCYIGDSDVFRQPYKTF